MSRKSIRITADTVDNLPGSCRECLFWELDPVRRARLDSAESSRQKSDWVSEVLREWGSCGQIAMVDDRPRGYLLYAPPTFLPGSEQFATAPVSPDAVLLTTAYVDPAWRGAGLGRLLVQGMARDLARRNRIAAVEAFGDTRGRSGHCVVPAGFLAGVGFRTQRPHPLHPRMRMDLRSTVSWKDEVEAALDRLRGVVRPSNVVPETRSGHREIQSS